MPRNMLREFGQRLPLTIQFAVVTAAFVFAAMSWFACTGPYHWIAALQISKFVYHQPVLSFIITFVAFYALLLGVCAIPVFAGDLHLRRTAIGKGGFLSAGSTAGVSVFYAVLCLTCGIYLCAYAARFQNPGYITAADLEQGRTPPSSWLVIDGKPYKSEVTEFGIRGRLGLSYIPLCSEGWKTSKPIGALLFIPTPRAAAFKEVTSRFQGMVSPIGIPGPVRDAFATDGLDIHLAIVLNADERPRDWTFTGIILIITGVALAVFAVFSINMWHKNRNWAQLRKPL